MTVYELQAHQLKTELEKEGTTLTKTAFLYINELEQKVNELENKLR